MGMSKSILAFNDVKEVMERVLNEGKGFKLTFKSDKAAIRWVHRANMFRRLDREENIKRHPETDHPLHGKSEFDTLWLSRQDNAVRVMEIKLEATIEEMED